MFLEIDFRRTNLQMPIKFNQLITLLFLIDPLIFRLPILYVQNRSHHYAISVTFEAYNFHLFELDHSLSERISLVETCFWFLFCGQVEALHFCRVLTPLLFFNTNMCRWFYCTLKTLMVYYVK
jgi:hypothetical protein